MFKKIIRNAFPPTVPILFGYLAIGIPYGLYTVMSGYPWWVAVFSSLVIFAGAGQYLAVGLFAAGAPLPQILFAEFILNIRHIVYGLSLIKSFKGTGIFKPYLIFALSDETYALLTATEVPDGCPKGPFYAAIAAMDQAYWVTGTLIGAAACSLLKRFNLESYLQGVDFALTALFVVIMIGQIQKSHDMAPTLTGLLTAAACVVLSRFGIIPSSNIIIIAIALGIAAIMLIKGRNFFKAHPDTQISSGGDEK